MKRCPCVKDDPVGGLPYAQAHAKAQQMLKLGYIQKRCPDCKRYTLWVKK